MGRSSDFLQLCLYWSKQDFQFTALTGKKITAVNGKCSENKIIDVYIDILFCYSTHLMFFFGGGERSDTFI